MKKLVFVLLAVLTLAACKKNNDNLIAGNFDNNNNNNNIEIYSKDGTFSVAVDPLNEIVDKITVYYISGTSARVKNVLRDTYGPPAGLISWSVCFSNADVETWIVTPDTKANLLTKTLPLHNEPVTESDENGDSLIFDTCN